MLTVLCSAKGSPGVTTTALGLMHTWPRRVLLVGADPGGDDLRQMYPVRQPGLGLQRLAGVRTQVTETIWDEIRALDAGTQQRLALFGLNAATQAQALAGMWEPLGRALRTLNDGGEDVDVVADAGRYVPEVGATGLFIRAHRVLVATGGSPWLLDATESLIRSLKDAGVHQDALGLILIDRSRYGVQDIRSSLGVPVRARLTRDPRSVETFREAVTAQPPKGTLSTELRRLAVELVRDHDREHAEQLADLEREVERAGR